MNLKSITQKTLQQPHFCRSRMAQIASITVYLNRQYEAHRAAPDVHGFANVIVWSQLNCKLSQRANTGKDTILVSTITQCREEQMTRFQLHTGQNRRLTCVHECVTSSRLDSISPKGKCYLVWDIRPICYLSPQLLSHHALQLPQNNVAMVQTFFGFFGNGQMFCSHRNRQLSTLSRCIDSNRRDPQLHS